MAAGKSPDGMLVQWIGRWNDGTRPVTITWRVAQPVEAAGLHPLRRIGVGGNHAGDVEILHRLRERAMRRLELIVPVSVLLIFVILFNAFGSVRNAAIILANVPLATIGGIIFTTAPTWPA